ncbi:hypothetical protein BS78_10G075400 [Paspalum vaginatum]|nr:hypothetical protein BS78_10G075400 [Paspalum vaginatum]
MGAFLTISSRDGNGPSLTVRSSGDADFNFRRSTRPWLLPSSISDGFVLICIPQVLGELALSFLGHQFWFVCPRLSMSSSLCPCTCQMPTHVSPTCSLLEVIR